MAGERSVDVLILGGGPAGSTAATMLAQAGIGCVVLEGERFPRFHVGESLLPHSLPLFDRLGVHDAVRALPHTRHKEGASFVTHDGGKHVVYWFDEALAPAIPHAYQVRRDEFDEALLDHARASGAEVLEGWKATALRWEGKRLAGLSARDPDGREVSFRCRAFLDASGQSSFVASRMGWRFPYPMHRKVAAVTHFRGAWLPPGRESGNITIALTGGGWFWLIPFKDDTVSVGAVVDVEKWREKGGGPEAIFEAAVAATPEVARRLASAQRLIPYNAVQNFSYRVMHIAGDGYCLVGDAAGFLDPIFSTGVFIGTTTGASAAQDVIEAFGRRGRVEANDFGPTIALTRSLQRMFFSFIRAYYDPHFLAFFFNPHDFLELPAAVVSLLAADVVRPGRWKRTGRYRILLGLALLQRVTSRLGRPIVEPLHASPAGMAP
ncbi:MAG TPA: NAD(P)/FAD-dependent oxidoreductase [Thermoanaerobaculaceae bacterium]|nr:NAD(P)/FAD-dependent oxidoreductase [Thermoanaerobaculaceae bacterium]